MKRFGFIFSNKFTLVLLIVFALSMAVATFIENDHGTAVARGLVYEAWWFELLMVLLAINFIGNIGRYRLFQSRRWALGLFHIAFVIIVVAAGVTRYFSKEGIIHIRQGNAQDTYYTSSHYLQVQQFGDQGGKRFEKPISLISHGFEPQTHQVSFGGTSFHVSFSEYIRAARETFVPGQDTLISLAVTMGSGRDDVMLLKGEEMALGNISVGTSRNAHNPIRIYKEDTVWMIQSEEHLQVIEMSTQKMGAIHGGDTQVLGFRTLYQWDGGAFMIKEIKENVALAYLQEEDETLAENLPNMVKIEISDQQDQPIAETFVKLVSFKPSWYSFSHLGKAYSLTYGPKAEALPFSLYLNAFEMERYPGSQSPSSYATEVMVLDGDKEFPYRIFMNNVLDYAGYRFYQSSYDSDEKGTILSVNQDRPGTYLTYVGYFLLSLGMFFTLFIQGSRFDALNKRLGNLKGLLLPVFFASLTATFANTPDVAKASIVPQEKAVEYGTLVVQDLDGRMKPLNTLAHEIVRKLSGKTFLPLPTGEGELKLSPEQFLLAVQMDPETFSNLPLIIIDAEKSREVFQTLGINPKESLSFQDFLGREGNYLLGDLVEKTNLLKPSERNEGDNELLKTDERFNIFYALLTGDFLRLFPNKLDPNNTWHTQTEYAQGFEEEDALFVRNIGSIYLAGLKKGIQEEDWADADEALGYLALFQQVAGKEVYPSQSLVKGELLYNKLNLGSKLFGPFWLLGSCMLLLAIWGMFYQSKRLEWVWKVGKYVSWMGLILFTFHLALRWYIASHPPWSNGFEMLVFVAWGTLLFGLLFSHKSVFTVPLGLLFSGTLLFVGFLDWLNPEITNLMPVLHSYWLKIHVAIIVSSYAPLALAAMLALLTLFLLLFKPKNPASKWWSSLQELTMVNEMAITIGLFLLAIGTFLGGVWANESWGRYWAWDPKETWALISIIVYAFVLHLRLVPSLKGPLVYNLASLWAFSSIVMTSFGVNYYLSGLHSYAKGDPLPVPLWVYWAVFLLLAISIAAGLRYSQFSIRDKNRLAIT